MTSAMYGKSNGKWDQVFPEPQRGVAPVLSAAPDATQIVYTWTAATGITPVSYEFEFNGVITDVGDVLTVTKSGLTTGNTYTARVRARAANYAGEWSNVLSTVAAVPYNEATGGTETTVTNYNGTGETWKVHTFTGNGTLTVTKASQPFRLLVVAPGGTGGTACPNGSGGAGGGGGAYLNLSQTIAAGATSVVVGPSHFSNADYHPNVGPASNSSFGTIVCGGGGSGGTGAWDGKKPEGGGSGGAAGSGGGAAGGAGTSGTRDRNPAGSAQGGEPAHATRGGLTSDITGTSVVYSVGGGGNDGWNPGDTAVGPGSGGGSNDPAGGPEAWASRAGIVVVAYRIA